MLLSIQLLKSHFIVAVSVSSCLEISAVCVCVCVCKMMLPREVFSFNIYFIYVFGCATSLVVACRLLVAACMWDLVPGPVMEPGSPALGAWSFNHCATRKVLRFIFFKLKYS